MLHFWECDGQDEIFTWLEGPTPDHPEGWQLNFNTSRMARWCAAEARLLGENDEHPEFEMIETKIQPSHIQHIIRRKNVNMGYASRLEASRLRDPVCGVLMACGQTLLVDGHHRLVGRSLAGFKDYRMYRVKPPYWERFLVKIIVANVESFLGVDKYRRMG